MTVPAMKNRRGCDVDEQTDDGDDHHAQAFDDRRLEKTAVRRGKDHADDQPESQTVEQRGEDFHPMKAVRALMRRRPLRHAKSEKTERHRADIGEHMAGIGKQRQTIG